MASELNEKIVKEWLKSNEVSARAIVEDYIQSHPLYMKELLQREMDQNQLLSLRPINTSSKGPRKLKHCKSTPSLFGNMASRRSTDELKKLPKQDLLMELLRDVLSPDFGINSLSHKILVNVLLLTNADRSSLFLVEGSSDSPILVSRLFDVTEHSTLSSVVHSHSDAIKIPFGVGIVGQAALTKETINLKDAYEDPRFNQKLDKLTGYRTKAILCMPIKTADGQVIGVAQVINKKDGDHFTKEDEEIFRMYLRFCAIGLLNVQLFDSTLAHSKRLQTLLQLAQKLFEDTTSSEEMLKCVMREAQMLIPCQKCVVLLVEEQEGDNIEFSKALEYDRNSSTNEEQMKVIEPSIVNGLDIALEVARTSQAVNLTGDDYKDIQTEGHHSSSILCMPIFDNSDKVIGVVKMDNKSNGLPFNSADQESFKVFAAFCGLGLHNVMNYEKVSLANARQSVALEVLSYHASASFDETSRLMEMKLPGIAELQLNSFLFDDLPLTDDQTILSSVVMFKELGFVAKYHIDIQSLFRWVLTVRKNYRPVTYHNWRHGFNVAQSMFTMLTSGNMGVKLNDLEKLALLVACLCHDLDHRGTNNAFQSKIDSPLAQLYSTSTMEHHHFNHCIMILNSKGNNIFKRLSTDQYQSILRYIESAILSTDLALYFKKKSGFIDLVENNDFSWEDKVHRDTLRGMLMTACDIAAITKPWEIQVRVAELVTSEFFEQGDMERNDLKLEPIAMMDRRKKHQLPKMQVGFIDSVCLPLYEVLVKLNEDLTPLYSGVKSNRDNWMSIADNPNISKSSLIAPTIAMITSAEPDINPVANGNKADHTPDDDLLKQKKSTKCTIS